MWPLGGCGPGFADDSRTQGIIRVDGCWTVCPGGEIFPGWAADEGQREAETRNVSSLEEAEKIINGERQDEYGNPEDSFKIIAGYWNVFLKARLGVERHLTPLDVANMMILFKQARKLGQKPKRDNYIDSIGYEAIGADRFLGKE